MRRWLGLACALVIGAGLLSGCQAGGDPSPSPTVSPPTSESVSPSESTSPPAEETPEAFIERWIAVHTEMQNTGDTAEFRRLSKGCQPCIGLADQVDEIYANGGFVKTDGWAVTSIERVSRKGHTHTYLVSIENPVTRLKETSSSSVRTLSAGSGVERFEVERSDESFIVRGISEQST